MIAQIAYKPRRAIFGDVRAARVRGAQHVAPALRTPRHAAVTAPAIAVSN